MLSLKLSLIKKSLTDFSVRLFRAFINRISMNYFFTSNSFLARLIFTNLSISTVTGEAINTEE